MFSNSLNLKRILLFLATTIILAVVIGFAVYFVYFMWQLKYGDASDRDTLMQTFEGRFSSVSSAPAPKTIEDTSIYIRPFDPVIGTPNAKITILAFVDFECPFCQESYTIFNQVIEQYEPVMRVVFKQFPLQSLHENAMNSAIASTCAHEQQKFWEYYHELFTTQRLDTESLMTNARNIGLNQNQFNSCITSEKYRSHIDSDLLDGAAIGVRGTPTYVVNNTIYEGVISLEQWNSIILELLNT